MIIENQRYTIELIGEQDLESVIEIYNSNEHFLINHTGLKRVSRQWLEEEYQNMKSMDFTTCKVTDKASKKIIAICDFKVQETVYLSLLMLSYKLKSRGIGKEIYDLLEAYFIKQKAHSIRIDVVYDYPDNVLGFWENIEFVKQDEIELSWNNLISKAYVMSKVVLG